MKAMIVLEDGSAYEGVSIGVAGEKMGEVVLNTAVVGYQEMMTDPGNAGKILVLTYPLIGNYGVAKKFNESRRCWIAGLVIKEASRIHSNWQAEGPFEGFLADQKVTAISDVDTRTLAVTIRDKGEMLGIVSTTDLKKESLLKKLKDHNAAKKDHIKHISVKQAVHAPGGAAGARIVVIDLGMRQSFLNQLKTLGCKVTLVPYSTNAADILRMEPDGVIVSNGPEDDASLPAVSDTVKRLVGKVPLMGIATGHQVIGMALGARITKMKIGHHGVNYPVRGNESFKGEITAQNHSYVVDEASLKKNKRVTVTQRNVNDHTVEAMESKALKLIGVQHDPVSPGFDEVNEAFRRFLSLVKPGKNVKQKKQARASSEVTYAKA